MQGRVEGRVEKKSRALALILEIPCMGIKKGGGQPVGKFLLEIPDAPLFLLPPRRSWRTMSLRWSLSTAERSRMRGLPEKTSDPLSLCLARSAYAYVSAIHHLPAGVFYGIIPFSTLYAYHESCGMWGLFRDETGQNALPQSLLQPATLRRRSRLCGDEER